MNFQNPNILYALFALIIPIIVHLFQLRRFKKTPFTNVKFLQELVLQTRKSSQIKKWLLLITRLLVYACIIIAFAQPYFKANTLVNKAKETVIYIDNSFSMQAKGERGELLKVAVQDVLQHFNDNEKISIITNTKTYRNTSVSEIKEALIGLKYSATQLPYKTVALKAAQLFGKHNNTVKRLLMISDFQKTLSLDSVYFNKNYTTNFIQVLPVSKKNITIDTAYFSNQLNEKLTLTLQLSKQTSSKNTIPISLFHKDTLISKTSAFFTSEKSKVEFDVPSQQKLDLQFSIDDEGLTFDNTLYVNRNRPDKIKVLAIGSAENNEFLSKIYTTDEFDFIKNTPSKINFSNFENQHILIWNEIETPSKALIQNTQQFVAKGGFVIVIPPSNLDATIYNLLTPSVYGTENSVVSRLTYINYSHPILSQVFEKKISNFQFPTFKKHYTLTHYKSVILGFENEQPLLVQKGNYYLFSASLNAKNSNIKQAPLIVPTLYNMAKNSLKIDSKYFIIGKQNQFDVNVKLHKDAVLHLKNNEIDFIPLQQIKGNKVSIETSVFPNQSGIYKVEDATGKTVASVAYNYNRNESNMQYYTVDDFKNEHIIASHSIASSVENINSMHKVPSVWKWFVIFAIAFLLIELLILKYFK